MINFSRISTNLIGVSLISILMVFWLGSRYLSDAYTQYSDAVHLQHTLAPETALFELAVSMDLERDEIQQILVGSAQYTYDLDHLDTLKANTSEHFKQAREEIIQSFSHRTKKNQERYNVELIYHLIDDLNDRFNRVSISTAIIAGQLNLHPAKRDEYVRLQMYDAYNQILVAIDNLRQNILPLPDKNYLDVLAAHNVKNAIWNLNDSISQIGTLVESYLLKHSVASIESLNVDNIAFRITQQHERVTQALTVLSATIKSGSVAGVSNESIAEFRLHYENKFRKLSKQYLLSTPEALDFSALLDEWNDVSQKTKVNVSFLKNSALSNTAKTAKSIKNNAIRLLFINTLLVLLCISMAYATFRIAKRIQFQADHDELTGMPNRRYFNNILSSLFKNTDVSKNEKLVLLTLDLNGFKAINDTMGHVAGDQLLIQVAERLTSAVHDNKTVARMGGDEFAIAYTFTDSNYPCEFARQIRLLFDRSFTIEDGLVKVDTSIGYSIYPNDADTLKQLQITSDFAMFSAKQSGRKIIQPYDRITAQKFENRITIEKDLVHAIENNELELNYQPQFNIALNHVDAVEALIRWNHPVRGLISPVEFIEVAEEAGLMPAIGSWVLNEACRQSAVWNKQGNTCLRVAVNVSVHQVMQSNFVDEVFNVLERHNISTSCLELEITESVVIADIDWIVESLAKIKAHGVRIALDDFGTGYSSLSLLQQLPLDVLKIDRSFISGLEDDTKNMKSITATIASIADVFGLETVAEGIETEQQLLIVNQLGIDVAQGYYYSKPLPQEVVLSAIANINSKAHNSPHSNRAA